MKTLDYQCECGYIFTFLQKNNPPPYCPECKGTNLTVLFGAPRMKNSNPPWSARHRRGLSKQKPTVFYPLFCDDDYEA